ncbi:MAG: zinc-binding dehydrogenase [Pseudomonadales bacterium]|nr:zinc-binding dehydrogenase [Pseudomonadales bacterium]
MPSSQSQTSAIPANYREMRTEITADGQLKLCLQRVDTPELGNGDVLIRIEAAPVNPSDLALLLGPADLSTLKVSGSADDPIVTAQVPPQFMRYVQGRAGQSLPLGNEGAGTVVAAGDDAQHLLGKVVSVAGGKMFAEYCVVPAAVCLPVNPPHTAKQAASSFVNPVTVLAQLETMRSEGQSALINTAAASNLGKMMIKVCAKDGIPLVNVVRKAEHVEQLKALGAEYVCNSSDKNFAEQLEHAIAATGAMIAFDCTGGGNMADKLLKAMEAVAARNEKEYSRYGSSTHKQVYIYGGLDRSPTTLTRSYGLAWSVSGWLLTAAMGKMGMEKVIEFKQRVASELDTTFASDYSAEVSLAGALSADAILSYAKQASGEKTLVCPH